MNRRRLVIVLLMIAILGVWMTQQRSGSRHSPTDPPVPAPDLPRAATAAPSREIASFSPFRPKKLSLPFRFEYPSNWMAGEEEGQGSPYQQVIVLGPRNALDTYNAGLTVRIMPTKTAGGQYENLEELVQRRRAQHGHSGRLEIVRDQPTRLLGLTGTELEFRVDMRLPQGGSHGSTPTEVQTHTILMAEGNRLFEFIYSADARDYGRYHEAFDHLLQSLAK